MTQDMSDFPRLAAVAVVLHEGQLLLVQRRKQPDSGLWGFPGGHVEWGEPVFQAAERELWEETTLRTKAERFLTNLDVIIPDEAGGVRFHYLLVAVQCAYEAGEPEARDDARDARWVPFDAVLNGALEMSRDVDTVLRLALDRC
ncbi:NUDIX hydrolase [Aquicoccus sp. G2-2]|uniref:NUDIX hydrolase n=1 Tax=Aquicoccus sp. G2-2 TaxID=3092120 RepID=UPI002AE08F1E|nr:NUDIX hydrolase [Aquicoccus sp. G2-2]MEA1112144.1 NUDIX hydrolase [Aquicoccus sp. G2-2]